LVDGVLAQPLTEGHESAAEGREATVGEAVSPLDTAGREHSLDPRCALELGLPLLCEKPVESGIL
jgi:hypothetical protein